MRPTVEPSALKRVKPWEYGLRFLFGGAVAAGAGYVAHRWGPVVGGLFLAFPAIFPASLTLVKELDGQSQAVDDARGGRLGSIGLMAFAAIVWLGASALSPWLVLLLATSAWLVINTGLWTLRYHRRR